MGGLFVQAKYPREKSVKQHPGTKMIPYWSYWYDYK
jgi:hypothetical protein